jgi:hypothetical protein
MRFPPELRGRDIAEAPTGVPLGRCRVLLVGVLPVERDDLCLAEIGPGHRFLERSAMATLALWEHERTVEPLGEAGSLLTDRLRWRPRAGLPAAAARPVVGALFRHRHRRLVSLFG